MNKMGEASIVDVPLCRLYYTVYYTYFNCYYVYVIYSLFNFTNDVLLSLFELLYTCTKNFFSSY